MQSIPLIWNDKFAGAAREAAEKSAVLLTNNGALPLPTSSRIGVFGELADTENTGDNGSSRVRAPYVVTPLQGLSDYLERELLLAGDENDPTAAAAAAAQLDAAIIVVGTTAADEGEYIPGSLGANALAMLPEKAAEALAASHASIVEEAGEGGALGAGVDRGGDRASLRLPDKQIALIKAVAASNPNTIVIIVSGSAIISVEWADDVAAIMQTFYAGMEGGLALARLLFGEVSPSGKLPFTVARSESDYPFFDINAQTIEYGPLHGYTLMASTGAEPQFAFGHGLSYARFDYRALKAQRANTGVSAEVTVTNIGDMDADEIVQLYVGFPNNIVERPARLLRGFERVRIKAGEQQTVRFNIPIEDLTYWDETTDQWRFEPGRYEIFAGPSGDQTSLLSAVLQL